MTRQTTRDPVNNVVLDARDRYGMAELGLMTNHVWRDDPRRLVFSLSRYKFVSKILSGRRNVVEVGCGDGFCAPVVRQEVERLTITDFDPLFIDAFRPPPETGRTIETRVFDPLRQRLEGDFDAAYLLDVLEHIDPAEEVRFIENILAGMACHATMIIGIPSLESQAHASPPSVAGHINCKSGPAMKAFLERFFHHVFIFSMNDEVVHTGYHKMAHYLLAVACEQRAKSPG